MARESRQAKRDRQYEEINEYRDLLEAPDRFEEGFTRKTLIGIFCLCEVSRCAVYHGYSSYREDYVWTVCKSRTCR